MLLWQQEKIELQPEHFNYLDTLQVQLPAQKFIKTVKGALAEYFQTKENLNRYIENVRLLMYFHGFTVETLGMAAGMHRSFIGRLIRKDDGFDNPSIDSIRKIAKALKVRPSFLVESDVKKLFAESIQGGAE